MEYARGYDGGDASLLKTHISPMCSIIVSGVDELGGMRAVAGVGYSLAPTY